MLEQLSIHKMTESYINNKISPEDLETIKKAKASMEDIGLLMQGLNKLGGTIETGIKIIEENIII